MKLAELQALFQQDILSKTLSPRLGAALRTPARAESVVETFAVYADGYRLRMIEFLANDYPVLQAAMAEEAFAVLAESYARAHPSRFRNARWFGSRLSDFLRATPPYADDGFICGLAAFEAALAASFDAEDAPELAIEILGVTREEDWPRLRFGFHPSVACIETDANALAFFEASQQGELAPRGGEGRPVLLVVWRRGVDDVQYRALDADEAFALLEAMAGVGFGDICTGLAFASPSCPEGELAMKAGQFLARWFSDGLIVAALPA